jgi:hypothetical protein
MNPVPFSAAKASRDESLFVAPSPYPFTSMKHGGGRCTPLGGEKCFFSHALFS